jgi:hypothetical protein
MKTGLSWLDWVVLFGAAGLIFVQLRKVHTRMSEVQDKLNAILAIQAEQAEAIDALTTAQTETSADVDKLIELVNALPSGDTPEEIAAVTAVLEQATAVRDKVVAQKDAAVAIAAKYTPPETPAEPVPES